MVVVGRVSEWLQRQKRIRVPQEWLEACIEWIQSEHQGSELREEALKSMVYEQWLVCDLRELEAACLPTNLVSQAKVHLNDVYNLQVESIVDVGAPLFGQLQKIKGADDTNINVTEASQATQAKWEPKPSRMLMLSATDGCQDIKVMEYRSIQCLNTSLSPGIKIQISGGVFCRMGVLMATSTNLQVLGGEVDTLVEKNTQEKVLCDALTESKLLSANPPAPKKWTSNSASNDSNSQKPPNSFPRSSGPWTANTFNAPPSVRPSNSTSNFSNSQKPSSSFPRSSVPPTQRTFNVPHASNHNVVRPKSQSTTWNIQASPARTVKSRPVFTALSIDIDKTELSIVNKPQQHEMTDEFDDDFDVDQFDALDTPWDDDVDESVLAEHMEFQEGPIQPPEPKLSVQCPPSNQIPPEKPPTSKPLFKTSPKTCSSSNLSLSSNETPLPKSSVPQKITPPPQMVISQLKTPLTQTVIPQIRRRELSGDIQPQIKKPLLSLATPLKPIIKKESVPSQAPSPVHFANDLKPNTSCQSNLPYSYLSTIVKSTPAKGATVRVKAYVSTLLGKLESNKGSHWSLAVLLNDGSASLEVELSNEFLAELIGFTASECLNIKRRSREDPSLNEVLKNALKGCQQRLIELCSIVEIESCGESLRPKVMRQIPITEEIVSQLKKRTTCFS